MKRAKRQPDDPQIVKLSISMSDVLYRWADRHWRAEGFNSLSGYIASLIRDDKKTEERVGAAARTQYPEHRPAASFAAEPNSPSPAEGKMAQILKSAAKKTPPPK